MRERVRLLVATCFYYSGLVNLALWWQRLFRRRLIILYYHRAYGERLRWQLDYLRRHYRVMHAEAALEQFFQSGKGARTLNTGPLPLVLTFDDGYRDNYTYAFSLARELQVPITIYLIPGYLEQGGNFWWLEGERLAQHARVAHIVLDEQTYALPNERLTLAKAIDRRARYAGSIAEREAFLAQMRQALDIPDGAIPEEDSLPLTWEQVTEMAKSEWVSFGAHTMHHPQLSYLTDAVELQYEVGECRRILEQRLHHPVRTFVYPIGKPEHIGEKGLEAVRVAGYEWAMTTIEITNRPQSDPLLLGRLPGDLDKHWLILASELVGLLGIFSRLRKRR
jgi:peptidoglycan/xylan/chitin deacetylase (PgdA/CDA1 family)